MSSQEHINIEHDPSDPRVIMFEHFARAVREAFLSAQKITIYRELSPADQLQCLLLGPMTAAATCAFLCSEEGADRGKNLEELFHKLAPLAVLNAEDEAKDRKRRFGRGR